MYENNKDNYRAKIIRDAKKLHVNEYKYALQIVEQANKINQHVGWTLFTPKKYKERSYGIFQNMAKDDKLFSKFENIRKIIKEL